MTTNADPLTGKVAILTGAATIFGIAVAQELVDQGAHIYLVDINRAGLAEALNQGGAAASDYAPISPATQESPKLSVKLPQRGVGLTC